MKKRLDEILVERKLAEDKKHAMALIMSGVVFADGRKSVSIAEKFGEAVGIEITKRCHYVSRGGLKLEGVIGFFGIDVSGKVCLDVGASTGGFTDCLLKSGAARVYALDVGRNLLDDTLRKNPKIIPIENVNFRHFEKIGRGFIKEKIDVITVDVSFISLKIILPVISGFFENGVKVLALVKPQFELGAEKLRKGVVSDKSATIDVLNDLVSFAKETSFEHKGSCESTIKGAKGNIEHFIYLIKR